MRGSAETITELKGVDKAADKLDGRDIDLDVDKDGSSSAHLASLSGGWKSLAGNIRATTTVLAASTIPFAIAGIGAATPSVLALGASLGGLALNLGKAAAGFGLVAGAAGGGALVGLKAYTSLITSTVSATRAVWEEQNKKTTEEVKAIRSQILLTHAANDFNKEINQQIIGLSHLQAAVGSQVFPAFTKEMRAWSPIIKEFTPLIASTAGTIARIATGFTRWFRTADDGQVLREVVGFLSTSAIKAAGALSSMAQIGVSAFLPLIPLASNLQDKILNILDATNSWVQSAQGQKKLGQIYQGLWNDAKKLWPVVRDLSIAVGNFFNLLDKTGIANQASKGLRTFAHWLREATERGGGLEDFLHNARALMPFVAGAATAVAGAIGKIATSVISARQAGHKLTILQQIFRGIGNAAKPLQHLVTNTFRQLGPSIAKLLPAVGRFLNTFAGSTGPLVTFVDTLTQALKAFNHLPKPVRETIAKLAALKLILGGLGVGAVVGPMGRFASNMVLANGAARRLAGKSALLGVAGGLAKIGLVLAGGIGLGILFFGLKRAYDKNEQFRDSVNRLGDKAKQAFGGIQKQINNQVIPALSRLADKAANILIDIFDLGGGQKDKIRQDGRTAVRQFGLGVRQEGKKQDDEGSPGYELGFKVMDGVLKGIKIASLNKKERSSSLLRQFLVSSINPINYIRLIGQKLAPIWQGAFRRSIKNVNWGSIGKFLVDQIRGALTLAGLVPYLNKQTEKYIVKPIGDTIKGRKWGNVGKFIAQGIVGGFSGFGLPEKIAEMVANAKKAIAKRIQAHSPARLFMPEGRNIGLGMLEGFKGVKLGDRIAAALKDSVKAARLNEIADKALDPLKSRIWGRVHYGGIKLGDMGDPRDALDDLLSQRRISRSDARYIDKASSVVSDQFRFLHAAAYKRLSDQMRKFGFSMFEDFTFLKNDAMRRFQRGGSSGGRSNQLMSRAESIQTYRHELRTIARLMPGASPYVQRQYRQDAANIKKAIDRLQAQRGGAHAPVSEDGMRRVMREHRSEIQHAARTGGGDAIDYNRLAHAIVGAMQSGLPGFIDNSMGGYFQHRNNMGADPR